MSEDSGKPVFRGSSEQVLAKLSELSFAGANVADVLWGMGAVEDGEASIEVGGLRLEVVGPDWSIVQDVYGCAEARACPDHTDEQREQSEAMILARTQGER